jgi:Ni,Fe-hydrogenase III large subunit/Ni,Fe-hydrogenase III component G
MTNPHVVPTVHETVRREISREGIGAATRELLDAAYRLALVAAHEDEDGGRVVHVFLAPGQAPVELVVPFAGDDASVPTMAGISYAAGRFERVNRDLYGIEPVGHPLPHRIVRHGHWPTGYFPMLRDADPAPVFADDVGQYPFVEVAGDGVYEIPVGPIHAGLIEPGHFRFSVVGETILRMKARLWFMHRGVEKLFEGRTPEAGIELAERISGDTSVGHSLAYAVAVEQALGITVPAAVQHRRALLLELERLYNHVADLGMIVNDVGYGIVNTHAARLREDLLRHNAKVTGHRLLRGAIGIGSCELAGPVDVALIRSVAADVADLVHISRGNHVVMDRLTETGVLPLATAQSLGTLGYVARASGMSIDARWDHPLTVMPDGTAYPELAGPVVETSGDVLARFTVRAREVAASSELVAWHLDHLSGLKGDTGAAGQTAPPVVSNEAPRSGLGVVEAWRGTLVHRVELAPDGTLSRVRPVDPSFFNWPALPIALKDTIVPDFPLTNKSFNQSYAGNDL